MAQVVQANVGQVTLFEYCFKLTVGFARIQRKLRLEEIREYPFAEGLLFPFHKEPPQAIGEVDGSFAILGLGLADDELLMHEIHRANYTKCSVVFIKVFPAHTAYLTRSHACEDLGVEEIVPCLIVFNQLHECFELILGQHLFLLTMDLRR